VLAQAYDAFEARISTSRSTEGLTKQQIATRHIAALPVGREFRLRDLRAALPGISDPTFRIALGALKETGEVRVDGSGQGAVWKRTTATINTAAS